MESYTMQEFKIKEEFYLNEEKIKIISGGIHYFRVVPEYWKVKSTWLQYSGNIYPIEFA